MEKYFIQQYFYESGNYYGGNAFKDAERTLLENEFTPIVFPNYNNFSFYSRISRLTYLIIQFLSIKKNSVIFFIHPVYGSMQKLLLSLLRYRKSIKKVCIIGDIDGIRDNDHQLLLEEIKLFKQCNIIIAQNISMKNWLISNAGIDESTIQTIGIFDCYVNPLERIRKFSFSVVFAGNLSKGSYVKRLYSTIRQNSRIEYHIYGEKVKKEELSHKNIHYHQGIVNIDLLPAIMEGSFGLIWDGDDVETCSDSVGNYMRYTSQHKLSLYIISSLPIIVWEEAATADFVKEYNIGFTIKSIKEIEEKIKQISTQDYLTMQLNMRPIAEKISSGYYMNKTIKETLLTIT